MKWLLPLGSNLFIGVHGTKLIGIGHHISFGINVSPAVIHNGKHVGVSGITAGKFKFVSVQHFVAILKVDKNAQIKILVSELIVEPSKK